MEWLSLPIFIILQAAPMADHPAHHLPTASAASKVLAVIMLAAPVIVMNSYKGIRNTPPSLLQMCRSFQGTRRQEVMKIVLPMRRASFSPACGSTRHGLHRHRHRRAPDPRPRIGDLITYNSSVADYPKMFAAIASIVALAASALYLLERLEAQMVPMIVEVRRAQETSTTTAWKRCATSTCRFPKGQLSTLLGRAAAGPRSSRSSRA